MSLYKIGIIGYGGFGKFLHQSWNHLTNAKVIAIADQNPAIKPPENIRFYKNWQALIKDAEVDIISIVTPPASHAEIACAALENEKHVLIEKPVAINMADANTIFYAAYHSKKVATVNYMLRFNPIVEALAKLSREKVFGELRRVDVENYAQDTSLPMDHWFWDPKISGGILIEHAVHFIDLVHFLTNQRFQKVTGMSHRRNEKQEDQVMANVVYDQGLIATHFHSFTRPDFFEDTSIRFSFDLAQIDIKGWIPLYGSITALVNRQTERMLMQLPNLKIDRAEKLVNQNIQSRGIPYSVEQSLSGTFRINKSKSEVYADCVCQMMTDIINAIENPEHALRVTLADGIKSLEIAYMATQFRG